MKSISVSTRVFARIWALRQEGEDDENSVLERVLTADFPNATPVPIFEESIGAPKASFYSRGPRTWSQPTWATDIAEVLQACGGRARLQKIYSDVRALRSKAGRSCPASLEATIRRTLENHSSDSRNYTGGANLFSMPEGKGEGLWALR